MSYIKLPFHDFFASKPRSAWEQLILQTSLRLLGLGGSLSGLGLLLTGFAWLHEPTLNSVISKPCGMETPCQPVSYAIKSPQPTATSQPKHFVADTLNLVAIRKNRDDKIIRDTLTLKPIGLEELARPRTNDDTRGRVSLLKNSNQANMLIGLPSVRTDELSDIKLRRQIALARTKPALNEQVESSPKSPAPIKPDNDSGCPTLPGVHYATIPIEGSTIDHPDSQHADLNLALRGYIASNAPAELTLYNGAADNDAPQMSGLFEPSRGADIRNTYQINQWQWDCNCRGEPINDWGATMTGLAATQGEAIYPPTRQADIYRNQYQALVLYADERQITLGYTRQDSVVVGYVVHLQGVCVEPQLLSLYRAQNDANGWRQSRQLPALTNRQPLGTAIDNEIQIAIRDNGAFLDPRSQKDWWQR